MQLSDCSYNVTQIHLLKGKLSGEVWTGKKQNWVQTGVNMIQWNISSNPTSWGQDNKLLYCNCDCDCDCSAEGKLAKHPIMQ